ncbi:MAG: hypothetical protein A2039_06260 [Candidatus Melainabacteria bacterium GWA2_34_9]|nr:MAG: hypothetical protein A2039_06260 [Candidatus Melainabacteria bacterium GWA2_34_9]
MAEPLKKFSTQANPELLNELKEIAQKEGKQFQLLVNEAFQDLIDKKKNLKPRKHVMTAFEKSLEEFDFLYENLAK